MIYYARVLSRVVLMGDSFTSDRLIDIRAVCELTSLSAPTIHRYVRKGLFPRSAVIGPNRRAWSEKVVLGWIREKLEAAR